MGITSLNENTLSQLNDCPDTCKDGIQPETITFGSISAITCDIMTRKTLKKLIGQSLTLSARVKDLSGITPQYGCFIPTVLLKGIHREGQTILTDHVWITPLNMAQGELFPEVKIGDIVKFNCTVSSYQREDHHRKHFDATLDGIRKFEIISSE